MKFQNFLENIAFQTELWLTAKNQGSSAKEKKKCSGIDLQAVASCIIPTSIKI